MPKHATSTSFAVKHGGWSIHRRMYQCWQDMKQRCYNPNNHNFKNYGERGIKVCQEWHTFEQFFADMGPMPDGLTLDRIDNAGNYEPSNCRWATKQQQRQNQRNKNQNAGKTHCRRGHPLSDDNVYHFVSTKGYRCRMCRTCNLESSKRRYAAMKETKE